MYRADITKPVHPLVSGLPEFAIYHGISVLGSASAENVAIVGRESAMTARSHGKGRIIGFGTGNTIQDQGPQLTDHQPQLEPGSRGEHESADESVSLAG
ncbi:MAG: hypothetical protein JNM99_12045 [Verrucomicrobiaceae bacterium]|nr:hypothetical protein [Verrucomicrobiaceae bacterium]